MRPGGLFLDASCHNSPIFLPLTGACFCQLCGGISIEICVSPLQMYFVRDERQEHFMVIIYFLPTHILTIYPFHLRFPLFPNCTHFHQDTMAPPFWFFYLW